MENIADFFSSCHIYTLHAYTNSDLLLSFPFWLFQLIRSTIILPGKKTWNMNKQGSPSSYSFFFWCLLTSLVERALITSIMSVYFCGINSLIQRLQPWWSAGSIFLIEVPPSQLTLALWSRKQQYQQNKPKHKKIK